MSTLMAALAALRESVVDRVSEQAEHGLEVVSVYVCDLCNDLAYAHGGKVAAEVFELWYEKKPDQQYGLGWWPQDESGHTARLAAIDSIINELKEQEHGSESSSS